MSERFFIPTPMPTNHKVATATKYAIYLDEAGKELKWSGKIKLPLKGERIYMSINAIGYGEVTGYFESEGWLGLMVKPEDPPDWWKKQNAKVRDATVHHGLCCVFGLEIRQEE